MNVTALQAFTEVKMIENPSQISEGIDFFHGMPKSIAKTQKEVGSSNPSVGYVVCESTGLTEDFGESLKDIDELWTASWWCRDVLQQLGKPVKVVPHFIADHAFHKEPDGPFTFLNVFDGGSRLFRKNPMQLIEAFKLAFKPDEDVQLVIKCHRVSDDIMEHLEGEGEGHNIIFINGIVDEAFMTRLYLNSHCYVSLSKCEGFGLPYLESMALGRPVIAPNYGGCTDFLDGWNSLGVEYDMGPVDDDFYRGSWAFPRTGSAAECMRTMVEEPGRRDIMAKGAFQTGLHWNLAHTIKSML